MDDLERLTNLQKEIIEALDKDLKKILINSNNSYYSVGDFYTILLQILADSIRSDTLAKYKDIYKANYLSNGFIVDIIERSSKNWITENEANKSDKNIQS